MRTTTDFPLRLTGAFITVVALLGATGLVSARLLARSASNREVATREYTDDLMVAERLRGEEERTVAVGRGFLITGAPDFLDRLDTAQSSLDRSVAQLANHVRSPEGQALLQEIQGAARDYEDAMGQVVAARQTNNDDAAMVLQFERDVVPKRQRLDRAIDAFVAHKVERLESAYAEARAEASRALGGAAIAVIAAIALASALSWRVGRQLVRAYGRELEAVAVAKHAVAAREELVGIVAHDLRSPLSAINLKAALLRKTSADERTRSAGASIENIAMRMDSVIHTLLDAASIEAGKFSIRMAPCDVGELLSEVVETLGAVAASKSIHLAIREGEGALRASADRARVLQVLMNLIGNALKFTPVGGRVEVGAGQRGPWIRFDVSDTGPGIAPEYAPHLFERFSKGDVSGQKGTGLGLYISKGIVESHGGTIGATSSDAGSTFFFTVPAAEATDTRRPPASETAAPAESHGGRA